MGKGCSKLYCRNPRCWQCRPANNITTMLLLVHVFCQLLSRVDLGWCLILRGESELAGGIFQNHRWRIHSLGNIRQAHKRKLMVELTLCLFDTVLKITLSLMILPYIAATHITFSGKRLVIDCDWLIGNNLRLRSTKNNKTPSHPMLKPHCTKLEITWVYEEKWRRGGYRWIGCSLLPSRRKLQFLTWAPKAPGNF